jgi:hypothetical protein
MGGRKAHLKHSHLRRVFTYVVAGGLAPHGAGFSHQARDLSRVTSAANAPLVYQLYVFMHGWKATCDIIIAECI